MAVRSQYQVVYTVDTYSDILLAWGAGCIIHCLGNDTWWTINNGQIIQQYLPSPSNRVIIKSAADFPVPDINGVTNLADFTTYQITGTVSGNFKFKCGVKCSFVGIDRVNDRLLSTTIGVMFDMDGTTTTKSNILFIDLTIGAANGTLFNVVSSAQNQAVGMISVTISATKNLGVMNNISTWAMTNIVIRNGATNSGFVITGNNGTIKCRLAVFGNNVGTTFNFTNSTQEVIDFNNNQISCSSGQTFLSGVPTNVTVWGKINNNTFTGAGNYVSGINVTDNLWNFSGNLGTGNTPIGTTGNSIEIINIDPTTPTTNQIWVFHHNQTPGLVTGMLGITHPTQQDNYFLKVNTANGIKSAVLN